MDNAWTMRTAQYHFRDARRKALIAELLDVLRRQRSAMLALDDIRSRLNVRGQRTLGHRVVPIDHIVGSEGRYTDFDRKFLPRSDKLKDRWSSIDRAMIESVALPPVELYKIGDIYFVRDGNHRVSVARQQGQIDIDAYVTELVVDVPLGPELSMRDLMLKEEYSDFLEWTSLARLRPDQRIEFTELGGYLDLVRHINAHRYYLGQDWKRDISREEAVAHWYDEVYLPIVNVVREHNALAFFPNRTEADLYRWIIEHRWYMRERTGEDPGPAIATSDYVEQFGQKGLLDTMAVGLHAALEKLGVRM